MKSVFHTFSSHPHQYQQDIPSHPIHKETSACQDGQEESSLEETWQGTQGIRFEEGMSYNSFSYATCTDFLTND